MNIKELRLKGYKTRTYQLRRIIPAIDLRKFVVPKSAIRGMTIPVKFAEHGGKTIVEVTTPDNKTFSVEANCSNKDNFSYRKGLKICLGRLEKYLK